MTEFKEQKVSKWLVVVGMMMIFILVAGGWRWLVGDGGDAGGGGVLPVFNFSQNPAWCTGLKALLTKLCSRLLLVLYVHAQL